MFKSLHGLQGTLAAALSSGGTVLTVDSESMGLLRCRLADGNHSYLLISNASGYEVVKLVDVQNTTATIVRGQDGTTARAFTAGSKVEFVLGDAAVQDIINEKLLGQVHLTGTGVAQVTKLGPNTYNIFVPPITIVSASTDIIVEGEYPAFVISAPIKSDCCG